MFGKKTDIQSNNDDIPKKRGRPRKDDIRNEVRVRVMQDKSEIEKPVDDEEIILRLPLYDDNSSLSGKDNSNKKYTMLSLSDKDSNDMITENSDINVKKLLSELKKKDLLIRKLKSEISSNKELSDTNSIQTNNDIRSKMLDLNLINFIDSNTIVVDKTNYACFWCTEKFDNLPCFLPDKFVGGKYYVFGCFCSPSCVRKYNSCMNDYRITIRDVLITKLYGSIFGDIPMAPERELLEKFGGPLKLEEFRNMAHLLKKEYRMKLPPIIPLLPIIEEEKKNQGNIIIPLKINQIKQKPIKN